MFNNNIIIDTGNTELGSFLFAFTGLPWIETHCVEHARQLLSDQILM